MKKIFLFHVLIFVCFAALLPSCKKSASSCKIIRIYSTDSFNRTDFIYDGNVLSRVNYTMKTGESQGYTLYNYSSTGKISSHEDLDSNGVILRKTEYLFDSNDRVITENYYVKSGSTFPLSAHYSFEYFSNGNLKRFIRYNSGSTIQETNNFTDYDANGNNTKGFDNNNLGVTVDTFFYTYDNHPNFQAILGYRGPENKNNPVTYEYKPTIGSIYNVTYTYRYNSNGDVIYEHESGAGEELFVDYTCN